MKDLDSDTWDLVSANNQGQPAGGGFPTGTNVNFDGRYAVFGAATTGMGLPDAVHEQLFVRDLLMKTTTCMTLSPNGEPANKISLSPRISPDGQLIVFQSAASNIAPGDTNGFSDIFLYDQAVGTSTRMILTTSGEQADADVTGPGLTLDLAEIVFASRATNVLPGVSNAMGQVFVKNLVTGVVEHLSMSPSGEPANADAGLCAISGDGRMVVWQSDATNLVPGVFTTQIYAHDRVLQKTFCASSSITGEPGNSSTEVPALSTDGRYVAFASASSNLLGGGPTWWSRYRKDLWTGEVIILSVNNQGNWGIGPSDGNNGISSDGRYVLFKSQSHTLSPEDPYADDDIFLRDTGWPTAPKNFCIAGTNSLGCLPSMSSAGVPSVSQASGFVLTASNLRNQKFGLLFYGTTASNFSAFPAGWLCVAPPLVRTPVQSSGGTLPPGDDCSGTIHFDFNTWASSGADPALVLGQGVWCQTWVRDPDLPATSHVSDGIQFGLGS